MDEKYFEGTLVLEKVAEINRLDDFFSAIDSDDFNKVKSILIKAQMNPETISLVLKKMHQADGEH